MEEAMQRQGAFDRSSPDLSLRLLRAVSSWQDQLTRLTQSEVARRPGAAAGRDIATVSVLTLVAMLGEPSQAGGSAPAGQQAATEDKDGTGAVPREMLASIMGDFASLELIATARQDLRQRIGLLFDEEVLRYGEVLDQAGPIDPVAAVRLYQAEYSLEAAR